LYVNRHQDPNNILYCQPVLHGPGQQTHSDYWVGRCYPPFCGVSVII
jgi:hypothetical protein